MYAVLFKINSLKSLSQHPLKNLLILFNWKKILRGISFLGFSNSSLICGIRFRENKQHPRMLLLIIYSVSNCLTGFDCKLHSNQFSRRLFPQKVSVKIAVILCMSIKLVNVAQTEYEFLCLIDMNKKDTYGIRRVHSMDIKCIERSNRPDVFCENIFLKISQKNERFEEKPV